MLRVTRSRCRCESLRVKSVVHLVIWSGRRLRRVSASPDARVRGLAQLRLVAQMVLRAGQVVAWHLLVRDRVVVG